MKGPVWSGKLVGSVASLTGLLLSKQVESHVFFLFDVEHLVRSLWQVLQWSFGTGRCAPVNVWGRVSNFVLTKVMLVIFLTP